MERNGIVGNAIARTDRSALIKATRASDFPQNQSGDCFRGPQMERNETQLLVMVDNGWLTFSLGHQLSSININYDGQDKSTISIN